MAYTASQNTSGTYDVFQDGNKITTGASNILGNYGLSPTQLSSGTATTALGATTPTTQTAPTTQTYVPQTQPAPAPAPTTQTNASTNPLNYAYQIGSYDQRSQLASQYSIQNYTGTADQNTQLLQKYNTALAQTKGQTVPSSPGEAQSKIADLTLATTQQQQQQQQQQDQFKQISNTLQADPAYQQLLQDQQQYLSSQNQQETLTQQYQDLSNQLGLPALNSQLINMKAVIDGTQNDIRNEITKAGGFATESQVQALAVARNKVLTQNYNNLLQTQQNAENQLNTMMGLAKEDRAQASQLIQEKLNFDQQIYDYQQKFTQNAQASLMNMQKTEGWDGIYKAALASGDPSAIQRINQTMGAGFDLATAAQQDYQSRLAAQQQAQMQAQQAQANLSKTYADIANTKANTAKTTAEINAASGTPNPQLANQTGYNAQGIKYTPALAASEIRNQIQVQGLTGTRNLLAPTIYNSFKAWWVEQGLKDSDFESIFGGMKDTSIPKQYN